MSDNLKLFFVKFIFIDLVQAVSYILFLYAFCKKSIDTKKFIICSLIFMTGASIIRLLPIHFGIHTLLSLILLIFLGSLYLKMDTVTVIKSTLICTVLLLITEFLSLITLMLIYGAPWVQDIMKHESFTRYVSGLPGNAVFFAAVLIFYVIMQRKSKITDNVQEEAVNE